MRMCLSSSRLAAFGSSRSGSALIEFALIVPLLMTALLGVHEVARVMRASHHMSNYVNAVAYDVAGASTTVTQASLRELIDRVALMVPEIIRDGESPWIGSPSNYVDVGISMVQMSSLDPTCQRNCGYRAKVVWSFGNLRRPCGEQSSIGAGSGISLQALPAGVFQSGALVVVDLRTSYRYLLSLNPVPPKDLSASAYFPVRNWRRFSTGAPPLSGSDSVYQADICPP